MEYTPVTFPITYEGRVCGQVQLQRTGLYTTARCQCERVSDAVLRVYIRSGGVPLCLGVLVPEGGKLCLRRQLPTSRLDPQVVIDSFAAESEIAATQTAIETAAPIDTTWVPWQGTVEGHSLTGLARMEGGQQVLAVDYNPAMPLPCLRLYATMTPLWHEGKLYLTLPCS